MASFRVVQTTPAADGSYKQLRVEDALAYLDKVKQQFGNKPQIYNKFLEIMKAFKAQNIDTPGVIRRVSDLFKGHNNLILGFNTFLPPGFKIEVVEDPALLNAMAANNAMAAPRAPVPAISAAVPAATVSAPTATSPTARQPKAAAPAPPVRTGPGAGPLEFDHAINYVTKIKRRFSHDPTTYKAFLEILHTYQKQQRSIKDVLERVSILFKDHPDLLRDFTYFLPDAVQESAKERLSRAAEQARMSSDKARAPMGGRIGNRAGYEPAPGRGGFEHGAGPIPGAGFSRPPVMGKDRERMRDMDREAEREANSRFEQDRLAAREESERDRERNRLIDRARDRLTVGMGPGKSPRMQVVARRRRGREEEMHLTLTPSERTFFERIKSCLGNREAWVEFLKCLDLYSAEVISRAELTTLLADIFGPQNMKLLDELKQLLNNRGALEMTAEDVWYSMPIGEIDLSQAARCTPSYRQLPDGYPLLACSERSHLEREVCNDHWVSVPTGSEDFSFKIMRKNQYEDQLFRCEDERYEIDMVIENNVSAIRVLEPLAEEIQALKEYTKGVEWQFRLDRRSLGVLHLRAIARVYGEFGNEVLELLRKNPAGAIPIILTRLKQKDEEWRKVRSELNKGWKDAMEKNYYKSLDHRSFYFKQHDKKHLAPKHLLSEMREKVDALESAVKEFLATRQESAAEKERARGNLASANQALKAENPNAMDVDASAGEATQPEEGVPNLATIPVALKTKLRSLVPELHYIYRDISVHKDAYAILAYAVEKSSVSADKGQIADLWRSFLVKFFHFEPEWTKSPDTTVRNQAFQLGQVVTTPYGIGVVENYKPAQYTVAPKDKEKDAALTHDSQYHVMFAWGRAVLAEADVKAADLSFASYNRDEVGTIAGGVAPKGRVKPANIAPATAKAPKTAEAAVEAIAAGGNALDIVQELEGVEFTSGPMPSPESIFYSTGAGYVFFRLHQMLVDRLLTARLLCASASAKGFREFGKPVVPHPADKAAEAAVALAPGTTAANKGHSHGEMRAAAAAAAGDLTAAAAAGIAAGVNAGGVPALLSPSLEASAGTHASAEESAHHTYQHFLTALYGLINGSMDPSKYEDECRELMGTGAYLLFTMDRLITHAVKQLSSMVHDPSMSKLRSLWEYTQAKIKLAQGTQRGAAADASIQSTLISYRANVGSAMVARGNEEVYCIQYAIDTPELAPEDILPDTALEAGQRAHKSASLSVRFVGKPVYEFGAANTVRGYQYAAALPAYLARLVGQGRVIMGDESVDEIEEEVAADEIAASASSATKPKHAVPYLARTAVRAALQAGIAPGDAGSAPDVVSTNSLVASVGDRGAMRFVGETEDSIVRNK